MRSFIRLLGSMVIGIALASIYRNAVRLVNEQQVWFFFMILVAVPATIMSFKEPTS